MKTEDLKVCEIILENEEVKAKLNIQGTYSKRDFKKVMLKVLDQLDQAEYKRSKNGKLGIY